MFLKGNAGRILEPTAFVNTKQLALLSLGKDRADLRPAKTVRKFVNRKQRLTEQVRSICGLGGSSKGYLQHGLLRIA